MMTKPDWKFWSAWPVATQIKLWQAVALSLDLDPDQIDEAYIDDRTLTLDEDGWSGQGHIGEQLLKDFCERLRLLNASLSSRHIFSPPNLNIGNPAFNGVRLDEFSVWCFRHNFRIPVKLSCIGEPLRLERQEQAKKIAGRYTLKGAADTIAKNAEERADEILKKLKTSAQSGELPMYEPGTNAKNLYGDGAEKQVRDDYEEAYWNDLNDWLEKHEPRIPFRFSHPNRLNPKTGHLISAAANNEDCTTFEILMNGKPIDWNYWRPLANITPAQGAKLANCIDPISWTGDYSHGGKFGSKLQVDLARLGQQFANVKAHWTLKELVSELGDEAAPFNMRAVVEAGVQQGKAIATLVAQRETPTIPGKLPRTTMGLLAVEASWELEQEKKRASIAKDVMAQLQKWADQGAKPETLLRSDKTKHGVYWRTTKGLEKFYDIEACGKTLQAWLKSRD